MPGYDGTGPWGAGTRTGRGLGPCGRPVDAATAAEDPAGDRSAVRRGFGPRGRGFGTRGRGGGFGRGARARGGLAGLATASRPPQGVLLRRMEALLAALDGVKELLARGRDAERTDREVERAPRAPES